ncbi:ATP-binding protein [Kitasatospora viridis]|uniref:Histidine kinase/HSP90-like ATPase domain-containing protein n=1 Tax=Kitasatospora viridis TaxID=281105 RepID=A0A561UMX1_9ACTN|nr:ATP-binding protein [Kitasatospora viridis]TWG00674.1 hypothetical protein FHX73_114554 [Kitasatospora viridis]
MPESLRPAHASAAPPTRLPHRLVLHIEPDLLDARTTRHQLHTCLKSWPMALPEDRIADALLCAAELLANAVVHTAKPAVLTATWTGSALQLAVHDQSHQLPLRRPQFGSAATSGQGLNLVQHLANRWGVIPPTGPTGSGKTIWCEIGPAAPPEPSQTDSPGRPSRQINPRHS